jgi:tetratricopeptide (TPR) repeat protein
LIANNARLLGDTALELQALREHYAKRTEQNQLVTSSDPLVQRYFEALWENGQAGREELRSCAQHATSHQLQLIAFVLAKDDRELVHVAIENTPLSSAWKSSRNAEVSLQLGEFESASEDYFNAALKFEPIGQLIQQKQDKNLQLVGDDWFQLAQTFGRWLYSSRNAEQKLKSRELLPARMENRPGDVDEQLRLGRWYLERKDLGPAIEHLSLAYESQPDNKYIIADLGSAFFLRGDKQKADQLWEKIIDQQAELDDYRLYLETLSKHNLDEQARKRLVPIVIKHVKDNSQSEEDTEYSSPQKQVDDLKKLVRALAVSFPDSQAEARTRFFAQLCAAAPYNNFLAVFVIRESLVPRKELAAFYEMVIAHSTGLDTYNYDYGFISLRQTNFDESDAESALDHETDYKPSEPESTRVKWEKEYLDYLIEQRRGDEARRLIASVERDIQRRYARPVWLRLASIRLDVRAGRIAPAINHLQWLVGIKTAVSLAEPKPPSIERLNDAVVLLRGEGRGAEARKLLETAYARGIALGQFEPTHVTGLARVAFERGDTSLALMWLRSMVDLTGADTKEQAAPSLMATQLIAEQTAGQPLNEDVQFDRTTALRLASETAGEFAAYGAAIDFRQQLLTVFPSDEENRIELIRLLAANGKKEDAIQNLAVTIADRNVTRTLRWQAIWLAPEIVRDDVSLWGNVRDRVRELNASDSEANAALEALSLSAAGNADEAVKLIAATETSMPNEYLNSLRAIVDKRNTADALDSFTKALIAAREPVASKSFVFVEDALLEQIVALYLKQNQPRAALKVAERVGAFQANKNSGEVGARPLVDTPARYQTLSERAEHRERAAHANLLALLSGAAEQLGDLNRAMELERLRLAFVNTVAERNATQARLDHLEQQSAAARVQKGSIVIDQRLVASEL